MQLGLRLRQSGLTYCAPQLATTRHMVGALEAESFRNWPLGNGVLLDDEMHLHRVPSSNGQRERRREAHDVAGAGGAADEWRLIPLDRHLARAAHEPVSL